MAETGAVFVPAFFMPVILLRTKVCVKRKAEAERRIVYGTL